MEGGDILKDVVAQSNGNSLLLFFVIVALSIPSIAIYLRMKAKKDIERFRAENKSEIDRIKIQAGLDNNQFNQWTEREKNLLQVIKENGDKSEKVAEAIVKLSTVMRMNNKACDACKAEQVELWKEARQDIKEVRDLVEALWHQTATKIIK